MNPAEPLAANLPVAADAPLPANYMAAKRALAHCVEIDECKALADKAQAMASYARQAKDDTLRKLADRIQARATRRCGELLKDFRTGPQAGRPKENREGTLPISEKQAADDAGLSEHQRKTAVRVANVPEAEFEQAVEGDDPPTVTALAELGRKQRAPNARRSKRAVRGRERGRLWGHMRDALGHFSNLPRPEDLVPAVPAARRADLGQHLAATIAWLQAFEKEWSNHVDTQSQD